MREEDKAKSQIVRRSPTQLFPELFPAELFGKKKAPQKELFEPKTVAAAIGLEPMTQ